MTEPARAAATTDTVGEWSTVTSHDGTAIAWRCDGPDPAVSTAGLAPVVLCNGIACDDGYWRDVWPAIAERTPTLRWHYRAHGRSAEPANPEEVFVSSSVRDLVAVMDAADLDRAVLVGHSFGVQVITEMTRHAPARVAGLVAVAGAVGHPLGTVLGRNAGAVLFPLLEMAMWPAPRVTASVLRSALRSPLAYWGGRLIGGIGQHAPRDVLRDYFAHVAQRDLDTMLRMLRAMQEHSAFELLAGITVPTTIMAGTDDGMTPVRHARRMADAVTDARLVEIDGGTHVLPIEFPARVVDEVLQVASAAAGSGRQERARAPG